MNIEYPPTLSGSDRDMILQIRSYLYRTAEMLNIMLVSDTGGEAENSAGYTEEIPKGARLILSSDDGWKRGTDASSVAGANLTGINDFYMYFAVISSGGTSEPVIVPLFRYGNTISGSVTTMTSASDYPITFVVGMDLSVSGGIPSMVLSEAYYIRHTDSGNDHFNLPGTLTGHYVRQLYALVI